MNEFKNLTYGELKRMIIKYSYYYYEKADSLVPDSYYDRLFRELERREEEDPSLKAFDSPTVSVGYRKDWRYTEDEEKETSGQQVEYEDNVNSV